MKNILIFIPDNLEKNNVGILEGFSKEVDNTLVFYITNNKLLRSSSNAIGYFSDNESNNYINSVKRFSELIFINSRTHKVRILNLPEDSTTATFVTYDYNAFKYSTISSIKHQSYGECFEALAKAVQCRYTVKRKSLSFLIYLLVLNICLFFIEGCLKAYKLLNIYLSYSATATYLNSNATTLKWALLQLKKEQKLPLGVGNMLLSRIVDCVFGILLLYFFLEHENQLVNFIYHITEYVIENLEHLLNFLMGSPVGLKLNHFLNKILGNFFLYHISLWRTFLHTCTPLLKLALHLLIIPGAFGLSFQAALLSDLIAFSTLHIYCIYVYAARIYGLQVRGLISLWRLFIGRKYNPLRKRVDSYQYNHHQLVIGTLKFTILFFLLPTVFLYYAVFFVFRVGLVAFDGILIRMRHILQCLPLYVCILWLFNSCRVKGAVKLSINPELGTVYATLNSLSLWQSIINSLPVTASKMPSVSWSLLFHSFTSGSLF